MSIVGTGLLQSCIPAFKQTFRHLELPKLSKTCHLGSIESETCWDLFGLHFRSLTSWSSSTTPTTFSLGIQRKLTGNVSGYTWVGLRSTSKWIHFFSKHVPAMFQQTCRWFGLDENHPISPQQVFGDTRRTCTRTWQSFIEMRSVAWTQIHWSLYRPFGGCSTAKSTHCWLSCSKFAQTFASTFNNLARLLSLQPRDSCFCTFLLVIGVIFPHRRVWWNLHLSEITSKSVFETNNKNIQMLVCHGWCCTHSLKDLK